MFKHLALACAAVLAPASTPQSVDPDARVERSIESVEADYCRGLHIKRDLKRMHYRCTDNEGNIRVTVALLQ